MYGTESVAARRLIETRSLRAFADGLISVALASYLIEIGFGARQIGLITTATLVGSAAATIMTGLFANHWSRSHLLIAAAVLMTMTGAGFLAVRSFWWMMPIAFVGTLNPSSGDVSVFLPLEQSAIADAVESSARTAVFARFSLGANLIAALGSLAAGGIAAVVSHNHLDHVRIGQAGFIVYSAVGLIVYWRYRSLPADPNGITATIGRHGLGESRPMVIRMAAVFSLDSFGGGFVVQTLLVLWLHQRHGMSEAGAGLLFSMTSLLAAFSMLAAPALARRIGLVNTMVFTHLPANLFLIATPLMPNLPLAVVMLLFRSLLSSMDVPARTAFVLSAVRPNERAAAASLTNVPRSLASAVSPAIAGQMLSLTPFGWPLIAGGALKACYDLLLLHMFGNVEHGPE
jgi:MFS family permease